MAEIYVSTDVETDGPIPGPHSLLSFASAAYQADRTLVATFEVNLETLPGASGHPETMHWWKSQPEAWVACRQNLQPPAKALRAYLRWVRTLPGEPVFVAYPAAFDFMWLQWYLVKFTDQQPFSHSALDIKSYAMALLKLEFRKTVKSAMPQHWFEALPHTHRALDDAKQQGVWFLNMLQARTGGEHDDG